MTKNILIYIVHHIFSIHFSGIEHLGWFWTLAIRVSFNKNQENRDCHLLLIVPIESPGFHSLPFMVIYHFNPAALLLLTSLPTVKKKKMAHTMRYFTPNVLSSEFLL